jgi:hypothetical protein
VLCFQHAADLSLSFEPVKLTTPSLPAIVQVVVMPLVLVSEGHALPQQAVLERQLDSHSGRATRRPHPLNRGCPPRERLIKT